MNSFQEIIDDYNRGDSSLKEAAFLLVNFIIRTGSEELPILPSKLEDEIIDIALVHVIGRNLEFYTSEGLIDDSQNGERLVEHVNRYLHAHSKKSLQEIAKHKYPDRV